jgi:hypothetical protein
MSIMFYQNERFVSFITEKYYAVSYNIIDYLSKLLELAELCHLELNAAEIPSLLKDVESIIQCTKTIQAVTLEENVDDFYAQGKCEGNISKLESLVLLIEMLND